MLLLVVVVVSGESDSEEPNSMPKRRMPFSLAAVAGAGRMKGS